MQVDGPLGAWGLLALRVFALGYFIFTVVWEVRPCVGGGKQHLASIEAGRTVMQQCMQRMLVQPCLLMHICKLATAAAWHASAASA